MKTAGFLRASLSSLALFSLLDGAYGQSMFPDTLWVPVIFYDYHADGRADFETCIGLDNNGIKGMVQNTLDAQRKPIPTSVACPTQPLSFPCACHLFEWFRVSGQNGSDATTLFLRDSTTTPERPRWYWTNLYPYQNRAGEYTGPNFTPTYAMANVIIIDSLPFLHMGKYNPTLVGFYEYSNAAFFKLDGRGFGEEPVNTAINPNHHNFGFTMELHTVFVYRKGLQFNFRGDDDVFAFVNGQLIMDLGGVHGALQASFNLDDFPGLVEGSTYPLDFFYAERHATASNIRITSNIIPTKPVPASIMVGPSDSILAGDTATIAGTVYDQFGRPMPASYNDSIVWTLDPATVQPGDILKIPQGDTNRFTATRAYRRVNIVGGYRDSLVAVLDTASIYIQAATPLQFVIEPSIPPPLNSDNRMGTITIGPNQNTATGYAFLHDRFQNFVRFSTHTLWESSQPSIISVPANGGGNRSIGEGIFTRVAPEGTALISALDSTSMLIATVTVVASAIVPVIPSHSTMPNVVGLSAVQRAGSIIITAGLPEKFAAGTVTLISISGKKLAEKSISGAGWHTIHLCNFPSGAHLLLLNAAGQTIVRKMPNL